MNRFGSQRSRQSGASLVVVLLILIVVTLLGAGAAQMALLGERTTRADRDRQVALQAAESALEDAYTDITSPSSTRAAVFAPGNRQGFVAGCNTGSTLRGLCLPNVGGKDVWYQVDFTNTDPNTANTTAVGDFTGRASMSGTGSGLVPSQPGRYIIEAVNDRSPGGGAGRTIYRVTAMGFGPTTDSRVVLQAEFKK